VKRLIFRLVLLALIGVIQRLKNSQDLKILEIVANELVIAIENALRYEEIEQFNVTLQKKIDDATKELKVSNEKLRALDEAKDEFVSMASHQLRTPLTSIKGYISMVLEGDAGKITDVQKQMLGQAFFSSQRMVYLISDLLNVSRLKTGKFIIEPKPVYLPDVVESEISQLQEGATAKNLTLSYVKPKEFPTILLDEMKTRQVIMNFTDNALYYTPTGGKITIELRDKGKSIEFTVKDTGIGVPKNEQHKLFAKFYRAENARKARPDGTGLGLFMAQKVIIAQGGSIIFNSKEGKGSTFGFELLDQVVAEEKDGRFKSRAGKWGTLATCRSRCYRRLRVTFRPTN
jgi:signal transduction histidine kinase